MKREVILTEKAVILAAGRGTRMQRTHGADVLSGDQAAVAQTGIKALMPVGRPLVDYALSALADAGYRKICLVTAPHHDALRNHARPFSGGRVTIDFATQHEPLGTANAILAAAEFVGNDHFLMINSDNYYPPAALHGLRNCGGAAVAAFSPEGLARGNISPERIQSFAVLSADDNGFLDRIVEKPSEQYFREHPGPPLVGMNCWRFTPTIFAACKAIPKSPRGEFELPDAVMVAIRELGEPFELVRCDEPVLDLSTRADVAEVTRRLKSVEVRL
ncbi:MAG: NTP transferase domain-containing protein [Pirellulales bacterium]|nr:NTP transferase domain-containing protein [Pirellulales bacterium]